MSQLPPLRALQIFEAVGRHGGIAEAARRLGISPGAVSQQMKLLEDVLGLHLTQKEGKRLRLTSAGEKYHQSCSAAFESLRVAHAEILRSRHEIHLSISAFPSLMAKWLAPLLLNWQTEYPEINIYMDGSHAEPSATSYEIDFRITYSDRVHQAENALELFRDSVVPVCSPGLIAPDKPLLQPADLLAYPLISVDWLPKFTSPPSWRDWLRHNQVGCSQLNEGYRVFSLSSIAIQAAIDGQGIMLGQCAMIAEDVRAGRLVIPFSRPMDLPSAYFLTWRQSAFDKPHYRLFHRWLVARGRAQQTLNAALLEDAGAKGPQVHVAIPDCD